MREYNTRAHIVVALIVIGALAQRYGIGFSVVTLGPIQAFVPNWAACIALGVGIVFVRQHREQVLGPVERWMRWVLVGEEERHG